MENRKKIFCKKTKNWIYPKSKEGYVSKALRMYYCNLKTLPSNDKEFLKARHMASRAFQEFQKQKENPTVEKPKRHRYRASGAGPKQKAPNVRDALFEWFIDIRGALKGRISIPMFLKEAKRLYAEWLADQDEWIPKENQLKFSKTWIKGEKTFQWRTETFFNNPVLHQDIAIN